MGRAQRAEDSGRALAPPIDKDRRIKTFPTQDSADAAALNRLIGLGQDPQLVFERERPATSAGRKFWSRLLPVKAQPYWI